MFGNIDLVKFSPGKSNLMSNRLIILIILLTSFQIVQAQKGEVSVSAGPVVSLWTGNYINGQLKTGLGLEVSMQYNFTNRSAVVAEAGLTSFIVKNNRIGSDTGTRYRKSINSFKVGYRYTFGATGIYSNILYGIDKNDNSLEGNFWISILGVGKRFTLKNQYFIDAGIDFIGSIYPRLNIKAAVGLRLPKDK